METTTTTTTTTISVTQRAPPRKGKHTPYKRDDVDFAKINMEHMLWMVLNSKHSFDSYPESGILLPFGQYWPAVHKGEILSPQRLQMYVAKKAESLRGQLLCAANMMKMGINCEDSEDDYKFYWAWAGKVAMFQGHMSAEERRRFNAKYAKPYKLRSIPAPHYPFKVKSRK